MAMTKLDLLRKAFDAQVEATRFEAEFYKHKAAYEKALGDALQAQGSAALADKRDGGDLDGFELLDAGYERLRKAEIIASGVYATAERAAYFVKLPQAKKDAVAIAWYTQKGRERAEQEVEGRAAAAFEDAAYGGE